MIVANSAIFITYFLLPKLILQRSPGYSLDELYLLGLASLANVVFAFLIWNWRRLGFWGVVVTSLLAFIINYRAISGPAAFFGLIGPVILGLLMSPKWARFK
jgi:hypothetical protein